MPPAMNDASCPISDFVASLKTYDDVGLEHSAQIIIDFDVKTFYAKCFHASPSYDLSLCDFNLLPRDMFKKDEKWITRDLLHTVTKCLAAIHGWSVKKSSVHPMQSFWPTR